MRAPSLLAAALLTASPSLSAIVPRAQDATPAEAGTKSQLSTPPEPEIPCSPESDETEAVAQQVGSTCNVQPGDFEFKGPAYPESCEFVSSRCEVVCSQLYDAWYLVFDAADHKLKKGNLSIPETAGNRRYHSSGIRFDEKNGRLATLHNDGAAFYTSGKEVDFPNYVAFWDAKGEDYKLLWKHDLNTEAGLAGCRGYQELNFLEDGSILALSTFGGCLVQITHDDDKVIKTELLFKSEFDEKNLPIPAGTSGVDKINGTAYLFNDLQKATLNILNVETKQNTVVKLNNGAGKIGDDGITVPKKFEGKCAVVCSEDEGWHFWCSRDGWQSADLVDTLPNKYVNGGAGQGELATRNGSSTAVYEVFRQGGKGDSLVYGNYEFFTDVPPGPGGETLPGDRTKFPQEDLTPRLDGLFKTFESGAANTAKPATAA